MSEPSAQGSSKAGLGQTLQLPLQLSPAYSTGLLLWVGCALCILLNSWRKRRWGAGSAGGHHLTALR